MSMSSEDDPLLSGTTEDLSFESALERLEVIVRRLEEGGLPLEESLKQYETGVTLLRRCYGQLRDAEQKVFALAGEDADGRPIIEPFERASSSDGDGLSAVPRRSRRSEGADEV